MSGLDHMHAHSSASDKPMDDPNQASERSDDAPCLCRASLRHDVPLVACVARPGSRSAPQVPQNCEPATRRVRHRGQNASIVMNRMLRRRASLPRKHRALGPDNGSRLDP